MKTLRIAMALVALTGVAGTAKADVNSGLQVALEMLRARNGVATLHRPSYYPRYDCQPGYHRPSPYTTPTAWDRNVSDLSRYHLSTPAWAQSSHEAIPPALEQIAGHVAQSQFYAPYQRCPPPRVGIDAPDVILHYIRGW